MTKALHCRNCNSIHSLDVSGNVTSCDCGKVKGWWHDPDNGLAYFFTPDPADRPLLHVISVHNGYLNDGPDYIPQSYLDPNTSQDIPYPQAQTDEFWRQLHQQAGLAPRAPETVRIFDASRRSCPFAIMNPGESLDVQWASTQQISDKLK